MTTKPINEVVFTMLAERGKIGDLSPNDAIFTSGLLDSLAATELMMELESNYGVDLADADFDISQLDTIADLEHLLSAP